MGRGIIYIFLFYFLALIQAGFLPHFSVFVRLSAGQGFYLNYIFIFIFLINIFENPEDKSGLAAGFFGGLFLDIFSLSNVLFFGFYTLISLFLAIFIKFILLKYVQIPGAK